MIKWLVQDPPGTTELKETLVFSFILLWIADTTFTIVGVDRHGMWLESNPWMRWLLEKDVIFFVAFKMGSLCFLLCLITHIRTWMWFAFNIIMVPVLWPWCLILFGSHL